MTPEQLLTIADSIAAAIVDAAEGRSDLTSIKAAIREKLNDLPGEHRPYQGALEALVLRAFNAAAGAALSEKERKAMDAQDRRERRTAGERTAVFVCGVLFLLLLVGLAYVVPNPTPFQENVFWALMATAAAGFTAFLPGALGIDLKGYGQAIRAGGALAVWLIVYTWRPGSVAMRDGAVIDSPPPIPASSLQQR